MIIDHQDPNAATAGAEGIGEARPQIRLINDRDRLLYVASLRHGNNTAILQVKNTILLKDGAQHGLHNDTRAGI